MERFRAATASVLFSMVDAGKARKINVSLNMVNESREHVRSIHLHHYGQTLDYSHASVQYKP